MNKKRSILCFVMAVFALVFGLFVTIISQNTQDLQGQEAQLKKEIALGAERIKVLEAEWAYLTRPEYLLSVVRKIDDSEWVVIKGGDMVASSDLMPIEPSQLAMSDAAQDSERATR